MALRLPNFVGVGPGRTGTTWLHEALRGHVGLPLNVKETSFWALNYDKGVEWYADHFRHCSPEQPIAEICPYFSFEVARQRISQHIPDCKIIITLRDPVERAYSAYKMLSRMALVSAPFDIAIEKHHLLVEGNRYGYHLNGWIESFDRKNVLITFYDDLKANRQHYLDGICDFVTIPRIDLRSRTFDRRATNSYETRPRNLKVARKARRLYYWLQNGRRYRTLNALESVGVWHFVFDGGKPFPPVTPDTEARLRERLIPEIEVVERITGRDLSAWKIPTHSESHPRPDAEHPCVAESGNRR